MTEKGFLSAPELVDTLSIQLGIPKITPDIKLLDTRLIKGLNQSFLFKNEFIPAFKEGNILTVIMADPLDEKLDGLGRRHLPEMTGEYSDVDRSGPARADTWAGAGFNQSRTRGGHDGFDATGDRDSRR